MSPFAFHSTLKIIDFLQQFCLRVRGSGLCSEAGLAGTVEVGHVPSQRHQQVGRRVPKLVVLRSLVPGNLFETLCTLLLVGERSDLVLLKLQGVEEVAETGVTKRGPIAGVRSFGWDIPTQTYSSRLSFVYSVQFLSLLGQFSPLCLFIFDFLFFFLFFFLFLLYLYFSIP